MILEIKKYPDEVLRQKSHPIDTITDEIKELASNMAETMYNAPGYGIAAPQVGVSKRLLVVDDSLGSDPTRLMKIVNPVIVESSGELFEEEGCLSIPGEYELVKRFSNVTVKYTDIDGQECVIEVEGLLSRIFQHEIDHLDGHLFIDDVTMLQRDRIKKSIKSRIKAGDYNVTETL